MSTEGSGGDGYLALGIGLILTFMYPRFLQWVGHELFGWSFSPFMLNGAVVPYPKVPEFWSDLAITLFTLALVVEGLVLLFAARSRPALMLATVVMATATLFNLGFAVLAFNRGPQIFSLLAVLFGSYATLQLWRRAKA